MVVVVDGIAEGRDRHHGAEDSENVDGDGDIFNCVEGLAIVLAAPAFGCP
jgi:hypothetical protein